MLLSLVAFVFVLGVLIFVHELGHFIAAKLAGIAVPRFSIGFGAPTPLRFRRGETEYVVAWFPLGGYVKMASREEQEAMSSLEGGATLEEYPPERLFESKPLWARIGVISAGVVMNVLFAWITYTALAAVYGREEDPTTTVVHVDANLLPEGAGALVDLPRGAQIVRVNGDSVRSWDAIVAAILDPRSDRLRFDFGGGLDPVLVPIRGTDADGRTRVAAALIPMWDAAVGMLSAGLPADKAGLRPLDRVVAIDGVPVATFYDMQQIVERSIGDTLEIGVARGDSALVLSVAPVAQEIENPVTGERRTVGRVGINPLIEPLRIRYGPVEAVAEGGRRSWQSASLVLVTLRGIVLRQVSARELGGPILIGQMSGEFARVGFSALLAFMAMLSVNLAILNLLPIPVLDGGHLVFLLLEGVRGRPLSLTARMRLTQIGLFVIVGLMVLVFTNDILRLFGG